MSKNPTPAQAARLTADDLADAVQQGVARALAARRNGSSTLTELTPGQAQAVSGGLTAAQVTLKPIVKLPCPPIIYGMIYPLDPKVLDAQSLATPVVRG